MDKLEAFYRDVAMKIAVQAFLIESLKMIAVDSAFTGKDTAGIAEAKKAIDNAFSKLENIYNRETKKLKVNQAR